MVTKLGIYISASKDEYLNEAQKSIKRAINKKVRSKGWEPWGYFEGGRLKYDWSCEEANKTMKQAHGAIVLAFAQWECKGLGPRHLEAGLKVSEGNHLEGGLAIAHGVPLLVVKEEGTQDRGILVEDFNHAVVSMPRGAMADWVSQNDRFQQEFSGWCQKVKQFAQSLKGKNVFIGHGHSPVWEDLRDYLKKRLHLPCDEFNSVTPAGKMTVERLLEIADQAAFAFLIMTAEDAQSSGTFHARMNVVHETGFMQGRLGFRRAIVLLEEGCETFSNIAGLNHIPFPKGQIRATFDKVRRVLEREGLIVAGSSGR